MFILLLYLVQSQIVEMQQPGQVYLMYNQSYQPGFKVPHPQCCTPSNLQLIVSPVLQIIARDGSIQQDSIGASVNGDGITVQTLSFDDSGFTVMTRCEQQKGIYSGMINIEFYIESIDKDISHLKFNYWFECGDSQQAFTFDWSMILLIVLACLAVTLMSSYAKVLSIRIKVSANNMLMAAQDRLFGQQQLYFQGFRVNIWYMGMYLIFVVAYYLLILIIRSSGFYLDYVFCMMVGLFGGYVFFNEIQCYFSANLRLQTVICRPIRICDIISSILTITLEVCYTVFYRPWYLTNVIALCIVGTTLKLFKFTSLKSGTLFLMACLLFDLLFYVGVNLMLQINYQSYVLQYANYPFLLQFPLFQFSYARVCCWLSISDVILPGLVIGYLNRFDRNRNSKIYTIISLLSLFVGIIVWLLVQVAASKENVQLPQSLFVFPFILVTTILWAYKQGDYLVLWEGSFYDKFLFDPFINTNKDMPLKEDSQVEQTIFKRLLIN